MSLTSSQNTVPFKKKTALKVFGGRLNGNRRVIMAVSSQRAFMEATGLSRDYFSVTGNREEINLALSAPGVVFWRDSHAAEGTKWHRVKTGKSV